ncbi:hypothetical protein PINS_up004977 [Pythium insidiosum]|nr:hypothetical protein PINS_up004977 [Pythium insidiosum]
MASVSDVDNDVSMDPNERTQAGRESSTDSANETTDSSTARSDSPRRRLWSQSISKELRDRLVDGMLHELHRITGKNDIPHLRQCASRYEKLVLKRSSSETEYIQRIEQRINSLRRRPSQEEGSLASSTGAEREPCQVVVPVRSAPSPSPRSSRRSSSGRSSGSRRSPRSRRLHRSSSASSSSSSSSSSSLSVAERDDQYFSRLRGMKTQYRDEVALVYRELCRVNTVIQHSATLRRHESNNLGDFLTNLKKIIYLLEQQPDEMHGMIPQRKRTLEYLDVVESHIQRKVLPILYRLRHTYSTILRPLMLNYLRNCTRATRRL